MKILLDEKPETADPFLTHLDQSEAEINGEVASNVTQPLPKPPQMQLNPLPKTQKDGGEELNYKQPKDHLRR